MNTTYTETESKQNLSLHLNQLSSAADLPNAPTHKERGPVNGELSKIFKAELLSAALSSLTVSSAVWLNFIISTSLTPTTSYSLYIKASKNVKNGLSLLLPGGLGKAGAGQSSHCVFQHHGGMLWGCAVHYYVREAFSFKCTAISMNLNKTLKGISCRKLMPGKSILNTTCPNLLSENNKAESRYSKC